jgi:N-acetylglucosaminyl-diphospho-decaprenol L-rhamnosyltransferase
MGLNGNDSPPDMNDSLHLSIIIVNWNLCDLLMDCLASVEKEMQLDPADYEVIVVDNASTDSSVATGRARFPRVRWVESAANLGFAAGCNLGYGLCRGRHVLLLNPDTVILDHAIDGMLSEFAQRPRAAALGSRLVNADFSFQRAAGGAFPSPGNVAWNYLFLNRLLPASWAPDPLFLEGDPQGVLEVDWVSGAAMLLRREALGATIFNESFFLFGEDMDLCDRLRGQGWQVLYSSLTTVLHYHGKSYQQQSSMEVLDTAVKGPREFFKRRHGRGEVLVYDLILLVGYAARWVLFGLISIARPGRGYGSLSSFSRRYALTMLRLLWQHPPAYGVSVDD